MSDAVERLKPLVAALSSEERDELVRYMDELDGVDPDADDWDPEYLEEINRRVEDIRSGKAKGIPA